MSNKSIDSINQKFISLKNTSQQLRKALIKYINLNSDQFIDRQLRWQYYQNISQKFDSYEEVRKLAQFSAMDYKVTKKSRHLDKCNQQINICIKILEEIENILFEAKLCS